MSDKYQTDLDFGRVYGCDDAFGKSMRALNDGYDAVGNLVCAGATGVDKADLPKMFRLGSGRHMRFDAVFAIGALSSIEVRRRALEPLAKCWGFGLGDLVQMSDKERADRYEVALRMLGPVGEQAIANALGGKP